ncbi:hypothetical protein LWI29_029217 [Acer saccharum]|uniref:Uncharacterized protein n=1 Tax=Acer saccharum TaxID=4024 RepID=A0AA39RFJ6_ACESA|nr:hypothetical protein LWI29_029217 [Acer saccharum]
MSLNPTSASSNDFSDTKFLCLFASLSRQIPNPKSLNYTVRRPRPPFSSWSAVRRSRPGSPSAVRRPPFAVLCFVDLLRNYIDNRLLSWLQGLL